MAIHKPAWFSPKTVMVSTAPTCGLTKGGRLLPLVNQTTGKRILVEDPETGGQTIAINDALLADVEALTNNKETDTLRFVPSTSVSMRAAVPTYFDHRYDEQFNTALKSEPEFSGFKSLSIAEMLGANLISIRGGHGSPNHEARVGDVPYIKVSDLRAGTVNINPTNRVPREIAHRMWGAPESGLKAFDLLSPERTSKNIGDFCVLMPGQEQVVLTKEIIVIRPGANADFDAFYLLWALTLKIVRNQWKRIVFMQTNREDVGKRYYEIRIPIAPSGKVARAVSEPFRRYYLSMAEARKDFGSYLSDPSKKHHFFVTSNEIPPESDDMP